MRLAGLLLVFPLLFALILALSAACGGDDEERLTDEEYFAKLAELDTNLDQRGEALFGNEEALAQDYADFFSGAAQTYDEELGKLNPPEDLQGEHDDLVSAIQAFKSAVADVEFEADAPADEFFSNEEISDEFAAVDPPFCALQAIADEKNIDADVGCEEGSGEEQLDPATLEPIETTEVLIQDFAFDPPHIQVSIGDTVTWTQGTDEEPHTATADDDSFRVPPGDPDKYLADEGETGEFTFEEAGEFPYYCEVHPEMLGQVTVLE